MIVVGEMLGWKGAETLYSGSAMFSACGLSWVSHRQSELRSENPGKHFGYAVEGSS